MDLDKNSKHYYGKKVLDNGLRIITVPRKDSLATTVLVMVETGSDYETKRINGVSHFLEHMCFKGTEKRSKAIDISNELNSLGAQYNAFTSNEMTGYYAKVQNIHFDKILEIISDMYLNPIFEPAEVEKEKGVIIEEINMTEDTPRRKIHDIFTSLLYGDQPAGWDVAGTKESVGGITRDDIVGYRGEHYVAKATTIVVAGGVEEDKIFSLASQLFSKIKIGEKIGKNKISENQDKPKLSVKYREVDQSHIVLGVRAYNLFDERRFALEVLTEILGGGFGSRLVERVREQMGAAYYVGSYANLFSDRGYMAAIAGVDHKKLKPVLAAILEECRVLTEKLVSEEELERVKNMISGHLIMDLETSDAQAHFYGSQEIIEKKITTPEELLKKLRNVTAEEIKEAARDVFKNDKLNLAVIGPQKETQKIEALLRF